MVTETIANGDRSDDESPRPVDVHRLIILMPWNVVSDSRHRLERDGGFCIANSRAQLLVPKSFVLLAVLFVDPVLVLLQHISEDIAVGYDGVTDLLISLLLVEIFVVDLLAEQHLLAHQCHVGRDGCFEQTDKLGAVRRGCNLLDQRKRVILGPRKENATFNSLRERKRGHCISHKFELGSAFAELVLQDLLIDQLAHLLLDEFKDAGLVFWPERINERSEQSAHVRNLAESILVELLNDVVVHLVRIPGDDGAVGAADTESTCETLYFGKLVGLICSDTMACRDVMNHLRQLPRVFLFLVHGAAHHGGA
mmetsp:Transcript_2388/g.3466  ORF Transcript_2388/g.3466 Transcript_2388/m.3466 type:complete len:310 (+) Transcript_2388:1702-2631(+)